MFFKNIWICSRLILYCTLQIKVSCIVDIGNRRFYLLFSCLISDFAPTSFPGSLCLPVTGCFNVIQTFLPSPPLAGKSCEALLCKNYAQCIATDEGHAQCRCPQNCSAGRRPVCGTNGKSYLNMCALKKEACNLGQMIRERNHGLCSKYSLDGGYTVEFR